MQAIFACEFRPELVPLDTLKYLIREFYPEDLDMNFAEGLLAGVIEKKDEVLKIIAEEAPQWPVERIAAIDRAILEIGCYEILFSSDVPAIVAINEGVEIAKSFGDTNSPKFINGVLSTVMHKHRPEEVRPPAQQEEPAAESKTTNDSSETAGDDSCESDTKDQTQEGTL